MLHVLACLLSARAVQRPVGRGRYRHARDATVHKVSNLICHLQAFLSSCAHHGSQAKNVVQKPRAASSTHWPFILGIPFSIIFVLLIAFSGNIKALLLRSRSRKQHGRWVRDRSLGGKMVFVSTSMDEDTVHGAAPRSRRASALEDAAAAADSLAGVARVAARPDSSGQPASALERAARTEAARPEWWVFTPPLLVTPARRAECTRRAKCLLRELENAKVAEGRDYDVFQLVQIYQACREGDTDVAGAVSTIASRDEMLRAAVRSSCKYTGMDGARATAVPPRDFICGLARCLGVEEGRAVAIVHAAVAEQLRAVLLEIAAARRGERGRVRTDSCCIACCPAVCGAAAAG
jgi:hypothetical protein